MCGIVGYVGLQDATEIIINGLEKLEYRGYDSAGISLISDQKNQLVKTKGRVADLIKALNKKDIKSGLGIGHTRWATHGQPSDANAHPHLSQNQKISVVHNGIIENYQELKQELLDKGYHFQSETDTEIVVNLIEDNYQGDLLKAVQATIKRLEGAFALGIVSSDHPDQIIAARRESPLIIGAGQAENFIASDVPAILKYTDQVYFLDNDEMAVLTADKIDFYDLNLEPVEKELTKIEWSVDAASKGGFSCFTEKEIHEQPTALNQTFCRRVKDKQLKLELEDLDLTKINKIEIVACGTSYHAGLIGKNLIEKYANLPVNVTVASEFRYQKNFIDDQTLIVAISQSGETADTLGGVKKAQTSGAKVLAISNVVGSSLTRIADATIYTWAGPEIGVCSTKAYTTQLMVFSMLTLELARLKQTIKLADYQKYLQLLLKLDQKVAGLLENDQVYRKIGQRIKAKKSAFYIGRGFDYALAMEGALKLKEISYIHTEAFAAGELKHGTIALIEPDTPVIVVATDPDLILKTKSNIQELRSRGAYVITISNSDEIKAVSDELIMLPTASDLENGMLAALPMQLIAYHTANALDRDIDKPRNLAKSVTVE